MSAQRWNPRNRADVLGTDGGREPCSFCGREAAVFELVDATPVRGGSWACGACRELWVREGSVSLSAWMAQLGAPADVVRKLRNTERQISRSAQ